MTEETKCMGGVVAGITILINANLPKPDEFYVIRNMGLIPWIKVEDSKYIGIVGCLEDLIYCIKHPEIVEKAIRDMDRTEREEQDESPSKLQ